MARLSALAAAVALIAVTTATPAEADAVTDWRPLIEDAARRSGLPAAWVEQVMRAESGGRTTLGGAPIRSRKGAIGLMQLMPATWADMRARLGLGPDPDDPRDNILAGAVYLRLMYDRFGYPGLFAAYNGGPARYRAWLSGMRPLPGETISYLASISARGGQPAPPDSPAQLFAVRDGASPGSPPDPLFAIRKAGR